MNREIVKILDIPEDLKRLVIYGEKLVEILELAGDRKVVIISINGRMRTGKSFMLRQFQRFLEFGKNFPEEWISQLLQSGFECSNAAQRVTSGIDVISRPYFVEIDREEVAVFLMDTQGLFDPQTAMRENMSIFVFSLLLSSVTIFNDKVSSTDMFEFLQAFLDYARIAASDGTAASDETNYQFKRLVLLLRDYQASDYLPGYYDPSQVPQGQDLNRNIMSEYFDTEASNLAPDVVQTRTDILKSFEEIGIYVSPPPYRPPAVLDTNPPRISEWDANFLRCTKEFVTMTLSPQALQNSIKRIGGVLQTGETLKSFVQGWSEVLLSAEGLPQFSTILEATMRIHFNQLIKTLTEDYEASMGEFIGVNPQGVSNEAFAEKHAIAEQVALTKFEDSRSIGGIEGKRRYEAALRESIASERGKCEAINAANVQAEEERRIADEERVRAEAARVEAIRQAENHLNAARADVEDARGQLQSVQGNPGRYTKTVTTKVVDRFIGINMGSSTYHHEEFDPARYNAAVSAAQAEITRREAIVVSAEAAFNEVRNMQF